MRKYHQKQLLDLIQTVYEANAHIKKYIDSKILKEQSDY